MISASEARIKTQEIIKHKIIDEMRDLDSLINNAIDNGNFEILLDGNLKQKTVERLKELEYKVEYETWGNESYYAIRWDE